MHPRSVPPGGTASISRGDRAMDFLTMVKLEHQIARIVRAASDARIIAFPLRLAVAGSPRRPAGDAPALSDVQKTSHLHFAGATVALTHNSLPFRVDARRPVSTARSTLLSTQTLMAKGELKARP